jgi:hypothetical protein
LTAVVVFPTPPFWFATARTTALIPRQKGFYGLGLDSLCESVHNRREC